MKKWERKKDNFCDAVKEKNMKITDKVNLFYPECKEKYNVYQKYTNICI